MPAPDYETIYDYEGAIEAAVKTLLTDNGITAYRQRDSDERVTPFAVVQLTTGAASGHMARLPNGDMRPDQFAGTLNIAIVTNRGTNNENHPTIRAKIRNLLYRFQETFTKAELAHHSIYNVLEAGTTPSIESEDDFDISTINFAIRFSIRHDAWPVAA